MALGPRPRVPFWRPAPESVYSAMAQKSSQWEDTAFFIGTLLLTAGGGLVVQASVDLSPVLAKLVWGSVGLVWGAVLIRVWIFREGRRHDGEGS